ncbi:MAG: M23 family metallopeptidase [Anaerolineales bacterium]|nr:M23 family metallopeptidase [Anaerolineales bacterium]
MNRKMRWLCAAIFLASCSTTTPLATATFSAPAPTLTLIAPTQTATALPTSLPTSTQTATPIPCDPLTADFCISAGSFLFQRPILPPGNDQVDRIYPYASTERGTRDPHHGVEFVNPLGTPVYTAGAGVIIFAGPDDVAIYSPWRMYYGNLVVIEHENNLFTLYAHLSKIVVQAGETVKAGEQIGEVGQSGVAIGSHLHFEVRRGDVEDYSSTMNPELWLTPRPSFGVLAFALFDAEMRFQRATITLERRSDADEILNVYYLETYHRSLALGEENAAIGDLPAGRYRLAFIYNGKMYERRIEVESGKRTDVVIIAR